MTVLPLIANCLANRLSISDWQGNSISSEWKPQLLDPELYKLNGTNLTDYIINHPAFWYYPKYWTPLFLKPETAFWVEHEINPDAFDNDEIDLPASHLGIYISTSMSEAAENEYADTLNVQTFYGHSRNTMSASPCSELISLDSSGKVLSREVQNLDAEDDSVMKHRTLRDSFFGVFPLTVISSQVDGESVVVLQKNGRIPLKNLNNKNKEKRAKAKKNSKMRYWDIVIG